MQRQIISKKDYLQISKANIKPQIKSDTYLERLYKYIPSEIILLYITCEKIILDQSQLNIWTYWALAGFCLLMTPLYLFFVQKVKKAKQLILSTLSFAVWVFALGGPFTLLSWYDPLYGALLLPVFTFTISLFQ
ncbi:MAG: hypothetical protein KBG82_05605 [Spirochaetes bacterium]|jgi:hypothetical protein|nr:hypothetical protein [Spirochaetota bacterium]NLJ05851.1 hypothetical protein [Exilispira sp.]MBP8991436.1 hypothetical protein [Spirochaetota bacterium]HNV43358.1 hypothetical protein [Exilispira sp.]HOV46084.1 hypothetical protein [Exilispira sp.]